MGEIKRIETKRLYLYPLEAEHIRMALDDYGGLCRRLRVEPGEKYGFFEWWRRRRVYAAKLALIEQQPRSWLLSTTWFIVDGSTLEILGEAGFKGPPSLGVIEIGYGLKAGARNRGYMSETVETLCRVAVAQTEYNVHTILAKTLKDNTPSHRVLEKNGFVRNGMIGKHWRWLKDMEKNEVTA
ncbi:MAG: GNAT family N-acetyltransferase [Oscillospiraceae bacterium]|nr:GNAT family N-acetyltransferase [Oscillospiraceae bacterium]